METTSLWYYNIPRAAYVHIKAGYDVDINQDLPDEAIDAVLPLRIAKQFIQFIIDEAPEMITSYRGRDLDDIKIINRLLDLCEHKLPAGPLPIIEEAGH